ncbi:MAG TPA: zinc ribbon domain-containing protein [Phycisphaerae bacterium]|nr:zinc ribbon domain-containing protein [Phycisphaerae bacterium]HOJ75812.1 zinc ribbon domain-containing protein [Phycisphaerae bacterium]HOM53198.1 zinc ribbon domain-containing protein [Phycisphaerae bacterium]HON67091.1 zinc ribbon domain-containing protein [Phycisphaerae bacterium]HOQ87332.1 zinc ribbon domain-containing protein [Phycisphaerae bacterium]
MPVYEYQSKDPEGKSCYRCRDAFDVMQSMSDPPLTVCPECGNPVERLISLPNVSTAQSVRSMLSDKNLKAKGFTKLVNEGDGKFRKI